MPVTLNGWERITLLLALVGGVTSGYIATNYYSLPESPDFQDEDMIRFRSDFGTVNSMAYVLKSDEIDAKVSKKQQELEAICANKSSSYAERRLICGGTTKPDFQYLSGAASEVRDSASFDESIALGFRNEYGLGLTPAQTVTKAKALRPDLSEKIDRVYSIRLDMLVTDIANRSEALWEYLSSVFKYYGVLLLWALIPGCCVYMTRFCIGWVRAGFAKGQL